MDVPIAVAEDVDEGFGFGGGRPFTGDEGPLAVIGEALGGAGEGFGVEGEEELEGELALFGGDGGAGLAVDSVSFLNSLHVRFHSQSRFLELRSQPADRGRVHQH